MSQYDELRETLGEAAGSVADADPNPVTWLAWITYFMEQLEKRSMDSNPGYQQAYREMLENLNDVLRNRIRTGGW